MATSLRLSDVDLMPLRLGDLTARLARLPELGEAEDWALSYWYDYLWDGDVFMPEDDELGEDMWARLTAEIAANREALGVFNAEQAWVLGSLAFSCCGPEKHERLWPDSTDEFDPRLLERTFEGHSSSQVPSEICPQGVTFGWLTNDEITAVDPRGEPELVAILERCRESGADLFAIASGDA